MRKQQHYYDCLVCVFFGFLNFIIFYVSRVACFYLGMRAKIHRLLCFLWCRKFFFYFFTFNLWSLNPQYKTDNSIVSLLNSIYFSTHTKIITITILGLILTKCLPELLRHEKSVSHWSFCFKDLFCYFRKENYLNKWIEKSRNFAKLTEGIYSRCCCCS